MSNSYFDWPAKSVSQRFVGFDTVRSADVNAALDLLSAGLDRLPTPYDANAGRASLGTDSGATNAYVVALGAVAAAQITSLQLGLKVAFKATHANTGASTLNVNGLGAVNIVRPDGATALTAGAILNGQMVECMYDGTSFQLLNSAN